MKAKNRTKNQILFVIVDIRIPSFPKFDIRSRRKEIDQMSKFRKFFCEYILKAISIGRETTYLWIAFVYEFYTISFAFKASHEVNPILYHFGNFWIRTDKIHSSFKFPMLTHSAILSNLSIPSINLLSVSGAPKRFTDSNLMSKYLKNNQVLMFDIVDIRATSLPKFNIGSRISYIRFLR